MTNREKFKDVFGKDIKWSDAIQPQMLALKSAQINGIDCMEEEWLNEEYQEPTTKNDLEFDCCISKEQTIQRVLTYFDCIDKGCDDEWVKGYEAGEEDAISVIKSMPSVTPQEPKTGEWIEHFDESGKWYECDQCHTDWGGAVNFCPNCGAKMAETEADNA